MPVEIAVEWKFKDGPCPEGLGGVEEIKLIGMEQNGLSKAFRSDSHDSMGEPSPGLFEKMSASKNF